jgi:hypothetical protein
VRISRRREGREARRVEVSDDSSEGEGAGRVGGLEQAGLGDEEETCLECAAGRCVHDRHQ